MPLLPDNWTWSLPSQLLCFGLGGVLEALEAEYDTLQENAVDFNVNEADPKEQAQARADPEYMLFLKAE